MAIPGWLVELVKWFAAVFGPEIVVVAKEKLQEMWGKRFANQNILILGAKQTGKTSLLSVMERGTPYEIVDDVKRPPNPTALVAVVDKKFTVDAGVWVKVKSDVPGDISLRDTWAQALHDIRPQGIIYMIDGGLADDALRAAVGEMFEYVLSHYAEGLRELGTLHVFLNFSDRWGKTRLIESAKCRQVSAIVQELLEPVAPLHELKVGVSAIHLSPHKKDWPDAIAALKRFAADLTPA